VLQSCLNTVSNVARQRGSTLLSAKLLVISRLLHKHLQAQSDQPLLKTLATRLGNLRQKLLQRIDKRFARATRDNASLIEDMTAFALATSSTPTDVLKHFHFIRLNTINRPETSQGAEESIIRRITLFVQTLRDVKACFPDLFASSLKLLGTKPLLDDSRIAALDELRLDLHAHWLPGSVRNYTPFTRYDELSSAKANDLGRIWGKEAYVSLITAVETDIQSVSNIETIVQIRKSALQLWLASGRQARGLPWHEILTKLRSPFVQQAQALLATDATTFGDALADTITSALKSWSSTGKTDFANGLWTRSLLTSNLSNGALDFRNDLITRRTGRDDTILRLVQILHEGRENTQRVHDILKEMSETRWEYDDDDDDDSASPIDELSKSDPNALQGIFSQSTSAAIASIEKSLAIQLQGPHPNFDDPNQPGPFILRAIRELRHGLPQISMIISKPSTTNKPSTSIVEPPICTSLVADLHAALGTSLVQRNVLTFASSLSNMVESRYNVQSLWAGTPVLPLQVSTGTFKYLRLLMKDMEAMGTDLWSPDALGCFRLLQQKALESKLEEQLQSLEDREKHIEDFVQAEKRRQQQHQGINGHTEHNNASPGDGAAIEATATDIAEKKDEDTTANASPNILTTLGIPNGTPATPNEEAAAALDNGKQTDDESMKPSTTQAVSSTTAETSNTSETPISEPTTEPTKQPTTDAPTEPTSRPTPPPRLPTQLTSKLIQLYFDVLYLDSAFPLSAATSHQAESSPLQAVAQRLKHKAQLDQAAEARVVKSAGEYWRKTYLLFGLLVGQ